MDLSQAYQQFGPAAAVPAFVGVSRAVVAKDIGFVQVRRLLGNRLAAHALFELESSPRCFVYEMDFGVASWLCYLEIVSNGPSLV